MTLTELKEYVQARRIVSELEIAMHFRVEPSVIEPMRAAGLTKADGQSRYGRNQMRRLHRLRGRYQTSLRMARSSIGDFRQEVVKRLGF